MENKKECCEDLYNKYKELKRKTRLGAHDVGLTTGEIPAEHINPSDIEEINKIKEKIEKCLDCSSDNQLIELCEDEEFSFKASEILAQRKN